MGASSFSKAWNSIFQLVVSTLPPCIIGDELPAQQRELHLLTTSGERANAASAVSQRDQDDGDEASYWPSVALCPPTDSKKDYIEQHTILRPRP